MKYRRLGSTGLRVSVLGFGGLQLQDVSVDYANKIINHALDRGINFFDTAPMYGDSEVKIGKAVCDKNDVVLSTKCHMIDTMGTEKLLTQSLLRLNVDKIDIYSLHQIDTEMILNKVLSRSGSLSAIKKAQKNGKISFIGITGNKPHILIKALKTGEFDVVMFPLNLIERYSTTKLITLANEMDIGTIVIRPLAGGLVVTPPFRFSFNKDPLEMISLSLRYVLSYNVSTALVGMSKIKHVDECCLIDNIESSLTYSEKNLLETIEESRRKFCTGCGGCMPCPEGIDIPTILEFDIFLKVFNLKFLSQTLYNRLTIKGDSCIACKVCENKCPYHLPIIDIIKELHELLSSENRTNLISPTVDDMI